MFPRHRTFSAQDRSFLQYSWEVYASYDPFCSVNTNSFLRDTSNARHFHGQCFGWMWFQLRLVSKTWTFLRPREWQFSICAERILVPEKASCVRFNHAFVVIFQCFCRLNNSQHRSWIEYSTWIPWLVKGNVTLRRFMVCREENH